MFWMRNKKIIFCYTLWTIGKGLMGAIIAITIKCTSPKLFDFLFVWFDFLRPINNLSVKQGQVFLGWTSTKLGYMCLAQGPQRSDAREARTRGPSVSSQALYHSATALPQTVWHSDGISERIILINLIWKKKIVRQQKIMQNYPACKLILCILTRNFPHKICFCCKTGKVLSYILYASYL